MQCPKCQFDNHEGVKFCEECGAKLDLECPRCNTKNPPGRKFCGECGHKLIEPYEALFVDFSEPQSYTPKFLVDKILTSRSSIEGERKLVTVLFADVANYTAISEKLDPEEIHQIMDGCFKILMNEIHKYEGTINQFTGDGVMALFGAPLSHEDHAQRACSAALSIQEALEGYSKNLDKSFGVDFNMRIGINSGPVVVGSIGDDLRMDYTAIGDTTNLAARMESVAEPGTILVSPKTYKRIRQHFIFEPLGEIKVKGKEEPLDVYMLISKTEKAGIGFERQIFSEMVGRNKELNKLELQVMKAVNGQGSVVNIIGEPGIGKSRLMAELKKKDIMKDVAIFEGKAISIGRNLSFHPITSLLKHWSRIKDDDNEVLALGKLEVALRSVCLEEANEILPFIATLMGMKLSGKFAQRVEGIEGDALEKLILKNMKALLAKASEISPLVIVMEDLHCADTSSIELLESLFRLAETLRVVFINVFRSGSKDTSDRIVQTLKEKLSVYYVEIKLQPLDGRNSTALIDNMLDTKGLYHNVKNKIIQRSGGNPFFIEEVVQSFIDYDAVVLKNDKYEVTNKITKILVPDTISDVLMARIDRLEEKTRDLVKVASVIGRNFFYRVLTEVAASIDDINARLKYLKKIQLIRERKRMEEIEFLFKHELAQQAAYDSILLQKRKQLHLKVADSIERVFNKRLHEFYGMLAFHYSKGENLDKAEKYLIKAGKEALRSSASNEALHYYQRALNLYIEKYGETANPEKIAMLEKNISLALYNKGHYVEAVEHFDRALNYYWGKLPKNTISAISKLLLASLHLLLTLYLPFLKFRKLPTQRDCEVVDLFYKKCKALAITDPKRFFFEFLYMYKKVTKFNFTNFELGFEIFMGASALFSFSGISFKFSRRILDFAKRRISKDNTKIFINYDFLETIHNYFEGNWKAIKEYNDDLVKENLSMGGIYDSSQHLYWHGLTKLYRGSIGEAKSLVNKLSEIVDVYENDFSLLLKYELNINLLIECRQLHDALNVVEEAINFAQKTNFDIYLFDMYSYKVWMHLLMGDTEKAEKSLQRANEIRLEVNAVPIELSTFCRSQLEYYLYRLDESLKDKNKSESHKYKKKAIKSSRMLLRVSKKAVQHRTESFKLKGIYYWLINKQKKALMWWEKAIEEGQRLGANLELSRTYMEVGKRLLDPESKYKELNGINADQYLNKAKTMFEEMDLHWDLDELERLYAYNRILVTKLP